MNLNEYLNDLEYIVNIDSGSDCHEGSEKIASFFEEKFLKMGWNTKKHNLAPNAGTCLVCTNTDAKKYDLMLIGHTDTVFKKGTAAERPFKKEGNIAYGPGITDMKSGCMLMYYLLKNLPPEVNEKLNIVAIFNPDEEMGSLDSRKVYLPYAEISDYVYLYEPTSNKGGHCIQRKGGYFLVVDFFGVPGHSGGVFTNGARSAVSEMAKWIVELDKIQNKEKDTTVNVIVTHGGEKSNVVPDFARIRVDIRFSDPGEPERIDQILLQLEEGAKKREIGIEYNIRRLKSPLLPCEKTKEYVAHIEELAKKNGMEFKHSLRGGLSDANIIGPCGAVCIDGLGPMGGHVHTPDEYLNIDTIIPNYNLSMMMIEDLANNKE